MVDFCWTFFGVCWNSQCRGLGSYLAYLLLIWVFDVYRFSWKCVIEKEKLRLEDLEVYQCVTVLFQLD